MDKKWCEKTKISAQELSSLKTILSFLCDNPQELGWRGKNKPDPTNKNDHEIIGLKYLKSIRKDIYPKSPSTIPDQMVSEILDIYFKYPREKLDQMKLEHQHSMAAENAIGTLLEKYIDGVARNYGWVHCSGELVKKVDFIKEDNGAYRLLQVKNRDNSENSSSSAIRNGTTIEKWFRSFSRSGRTNWESFPDKQLSQVLNEKEFLQFVQTSYGSMKSKE